MPLSVRSVISKIYAHHTGQTVNHIEERLERDHFLSADEAKTFGLLDEVIANRPEGLLVGGGLAGSTAEE